MKELASAFGVRGVGNVWGLTEFPIACCSDPDRDPVAKLASTVGRPSPGVDVRVVDGELRVRGPQCFLGYTDSGLNDASFDNEGWYRTGDLGEVDEEGYVTITGRLKDVIIRNGENISALEIEDVLIGHGDINDAAVIGVPDARTGERVVALVVLAPARTTTLEDLREHFVSLGVARQRSPNRLRSSITFHATRWESPSRTNFDAVSYPRTRLMCREDPLPRRRSGQ